MRILLDTHVLLWVAVDSPRLSASARSLILDAEASFSAASIWEVIIKSGLGRDDFVVDAENLRRGLLRNGFAELPVTGAHALEVARLPDMHRDPFDRILLAQARWEGMSLGSVDAELMGLPGVVDLR